MLPLLPVIVIVRFPVEALLLTVTFMVEVPAPVIEVGLKVMVRPLPPPEADREIAELKPPVTVEVMVELPELPWAMLIDVGDALIEKPGAVPVTVRETVVIEVVAPEVPVTVMRYVPTTVEDATVNVRVELPVPVTVDGLNPTVTPVGIPEADNVTAELNPPLTVLATVELPELPCATETEAGEAEMLKTGAGPETRPEFRLAGGLAAGKKDLSWASKRHRVRGCIGSFVLCSRTALRALNRDGNVPLAGSNWSM